MTVTTVLYERLDGTPGSVHVAGENAEKDVAYYTDLGYTIISVTTSDFCEVCEGRGVVLKIGRNRPTLYLPKHFKPCKACGGKS